MCKSSVQIHENSKGGLTHTKSDTRWSCNPSLRGCHRICPVEFHKNLWAVAHLLNRLLLKPRPKRVSYVYFNFPKKLNNVWGGAHLPLLILRDRLLLGPKAKWSRHVVKWHSVLPRWHHPRGTMSNREDTLTCRVTICWTDRQHLLTECHWNNLSLNSTLHITEAKGVYEVGDDAVSAILSVCILQGLRTFRLRENAIIMHAGWLH